MVLTDKRLAEGMPPLFYLNTLHFHRFVFDLWKQVYNTPLTNLLWIRVLRDGAIHGTREKRANIRCNEAQRSGKYATEDGDARVARDGTAAAKRSENADSLRRNDEKKRRCSRLFFR